MHLRKGERFIGLDLREVQITWCGIEVALSMVITVESYDAFRAAARMAESYVCLGCRAALVDRRLAREAPAAQGSHS